MPDFEKFADECWSEAALWTDTPSCDPRRIYKTAERHARLLQQVWEWAQPVDGDDLSFEIPRLKAHVRDLLTQEGRS